jgi:hypothetical protein
MASNSPRRKTVPKAGNKPSFPSRKSSDGKSQDYNTGDAENILCIVKTVVTRGTVLSTRWWLRDLTIKRSYNISRLRRRKMG